jgi:hypothetical protein
VSRVNVKDLALVLAPVAAALALQSCVVKAADEIVMLPNIPTPEGSSLRFCYYKGNGFVVWVERNGTTCPSSHPWPLVWADPSHIPAAMIVEELPQ